jgi:hypothetical protein
MKRFKVTLTTTNTAECFLVYALNPVHAQEIVKHVEGIKYNDSQMWSIVKATDRTKFRVPPTII